MKPLKRKLRGAQRVVVLQADVMRLRAAAEALEAKVPSKSRWPLEPWTPLEEAARAAWRAASSAMADLYSFSPKRALALAAQLGDIGPSFSAQMHEATQDARGRSQFSREKHEVSAAGLPFGTGREDQRKLKKARAAARRKKSRPRDV